MNFAAGSLKCEIHLAVKCNLKVLLRERVIKLHGNFTKYIIEPCPWGSISVYKLVGNGKLILSVVNKNSTNAI